MAVGRICCEDVAGKLNEQSVVLETSRSMGMGKRVKLNLGNLPGYSVFPGQVSMIPAAKLLAFLPMVT
jgi:DNA polymerase alpha subunit B